MSTAKHSTASNGTATGVARAMWNGVVLAETTRPVLRKGNVYFPPEDVRYEHLAATWHWSLCAWKGLARYYTARAGGQQNTNVPGITGTPARSPARSKPCGVLARRAGGHRPGITAPAVTQPWAASVPDAGAAPGTTSGTQG